MRAFTHTDNSEMDIHVSDIHRRVFVRLLQQVKGLFCPCQLLLILLLCKVDSMANFLTFTSLVSLLGDWPHILGKGDHS
jgi:hypothetical protein